MNDRRQISKLLNHSKAIKVSSILYSAFCISIFLTLAAGCASPDEKESISVQIEQLMQEKTELQKQIEQSEEDNKQLKQQIQVLSGLPENVKLENINLLKNIKIGRYTGFFDKDKDGKKEKLIVYIQPFDEQGDAIKAVGTVEVQLWDLNKTDQEALLGEWKVETSELKDLWFATMLSINYRLIFDVADIIKNLEEPSTVKITFTDYMTGKVFKEQKVIKAP
jgi:outer membrane murein-binding lipoprotein Lpp